MFGAILTLLQVCQSHWKGRAFGSFSTNSMTSILSFGLSSYGSLR